MDAIQRLGLPVLTLGFVVLASTPSWAQPPVITLQPQDQSARVGENVTFSVAASGSPPLTYQWRFNGFVWPNATNATLVLTNVQLFHEANYSVIVSNAEGGSVSASAHLTVCWAVRLDVIDRNSNVNPWSSLGLKFDVAGNIYRTWNFYSPSNATQFLITKLDSNFQEIWHASLEDPQFTNSPAVDVAPDASGNLYAVASARSATPPFDATMFLLRFDASGKQVWSANSKPVFAPSAMVLDKADNIHLTGTMTNDSHDFVTVKYDSQGQLLWMATSRNPSPTYYSASVLAVDDSGNVYVGSPSPNDPYRGDIATTKYDKAGQQLWVVRRPFAYYDPAFAHSMHLDRAGNVYVTFYYHTLSNDNVHLTLKYDTNGNELWELRAPYTDSGSPLTALDEAGNFYFSCLRLDYWHRPQRDFLTLKCDPDGNRLWVVFTPGFDQTDESLQGIRINPSSAVEILSAVGGTFLTPRNFGLVKVRYLQNVSPGLPTFHGELSGVGFFDIHAPEQRVWLGSAASFRPIITGAEPVSYQWRLNGTNLPGATNAALVLTNVQPTDNGSYSLLATNAIGCALSPEAILTGVQPPATPVRLSVTHFGASFWFQVDSGWVGMFSLQRSTNLVDWVDDGGGLPERALGSRTSVTVKCFIG
ncbi:MAG: immunoglobulin domain-containing protein [Limisphaerales bacterium]